MRLLRKALSFLLVFSLLWGTVPMTVLAESTAETAQVMEATPESAPGPTAPPTAAPQKAEPAAPQAEETAQAAETSQPEEPVAPEETDTPSITVEPSVAPEESPSAEPSLEPEESPSAVPSLEPETLTPPVLEGFTLGFAGEGVAVLAYTGANDSVTLPAQVEGWPLVAVATGAFANLPTLAEVTLPEGVQRLESAAFDNCPALARINLPASLTDVAADAVKDCPLARVFAPEGSVAAAYALTLQPTTGMSLMGYGLESEPLPFSDAFVTNELNTGDWYAAPAEYELDWVAFADYQPVNDELVTSQQQLEDALTLSSPDWMQASVHVYLDEQNHYRVWVNLKPQQAGTGTYTLTATLGGNVYTTVQDVTVHAYDGAFSDGATKLNLNPDVVTQDGTAWVASAVANLPYNVNDLFTSSNSGELEKWNWCLSDAQGEHYLGESTTNHYYTFTQAETPFTVWCGYGTNLRVTSAEITMRASSEFDAYFQTTAYCDPSDGWYYAPGHSVYDHYASYQLAEGLPVDASKIRYGVTGGEGVVTPSILGGQEQIWLKLLPIGVGDANLTLTAYFPTFSVSKNIAITVQGLPTTYPNSMTLSQTDIFTTPGEAFNWPTVSFSPADTGAETAHRWIHRTNLEETIEIENEDGTYQTSYTLSEAGVYTYDMVCGLGMGVTYSAPFTVYCGVSKAAEGADFDSVFTLKDVYADNWGYYPGIATRQFYANLQPIDYAGQTITYQTYVQNNVPLHADVQPEDNGTASLWLTPLGLGTASFTLLAIMDGVVYQKTFTVEITDFGMSNVPAAVKMPQTEYHTTVGTPIDLTGYTAVPSTAELSNLPAGNRIFRVLNDNLPDAGWEYQPDHVEFSTWTFTSPGVYYCQLVFAIGMNIEVTSDVFTVFVDTEDTDFNRAFYIETNFGRGMPAAFYGGAEQAPYTCALHLYDGMGIDGFSVNEMTPQDPDLLDVTWSMQDGYCLFHMQPKGYGNTSLFIGVQDSNGVNYGQQFSIQLEPLPADWALPTVQITGLNADRQLVVDGTADSFAIPYTLEGAYATAFASQAIIVPMNNYGWNHFEDQGSGNYHFDQSGIYPMQLWSIYRNMPLTYQFYVVVKNADDSLPQPSLSTYFSFHWNQDGDNGLYFVPDLAEEVGFGDVSLLDDSLFDASQISYSVEPQLAEGEKPCALFRLQEGGEEDSPSFRSLMILPNPDGAAGITQYRLTATIARGDGQEPLVLSDDFSVRMQALDGATLPVNPLALTADDLYLEYHPAPAGQDWYDYSPEMPGIVLPEGKAFPQNCSIELYEYGKDSVWYRWDQLDQDGAWDAISSGQPFVISYGGNEVRAHDMRYVVRLGNLRWDAAFTMRIGVETTDATMLFDAYANDRTMFYGGDARTQVYLMFFWNARKLNVTDYGAEVVSGDDLFSQLDTFTDDRYDTEEHSYTQITVNGYLKGTGTATVRLWAVIDGVTYSRVATFTVVPLPEDILGDVTLTDGDTLTVKAGEHFGVPAIQENVTTDQYEWSRYVFLKGDGGLLQDNGQWDDHGAMDNIEFWVDQPGRYVMTYEVQFGANYVIEKPINLTVTQEDGTFPAQKVTLDTNSWRTWLPVMAVGRGNMDFDLGDMYANGTVIRDGDTEEWTWEVDSADVGALANLHIAPQASGDGDQPSSAVLWGSFPLRAGTVSVTPCYKVYNAGQLIYYSEPSETKPITVLLVDTVRMLNLRFQPGKTEYYADESGFVHVDSLIPYEADGLEHETFHSSYWLESGPDMDTASLEETGDSDSMKGVDLHLNPDMPGTYVLCQNVWTFGVGDDNQCTARIRIVVGGEDHAEITMRAGDTYPMSLSLHNNAQLAYLDFYTDGVALGDTLTWTLQRLSGTSADVRIVDEQGKHTLNMTQLMQETDSDPRCLLVVEDCSAVGRTAYRLSANVLTAGGKTFTAFMDFAYDVVDDTADPGYLPTLTAATTDYSIRVGEMLSLEQPTVTLPTGMSENELFCYWTSDQNLFRLNSMADGKLNTSVCALEPGQYNLRFTAARGQKPAIIDYHITVRAADDTLPTDHPAIELRNTRNKVVTDLSTTLLSDPGAWESIGRATLTGAVLDADDEVALNVTPAQGSNVEIRVMPITRCYYLVLARCQQYNMPNESFDLNFTRNGVDVGGTSFTISAPTKTIDVTAIDVQNSGADTLLALAQTQLTATVTPGNASDASVRWSLSSTAAATVSDTGLVTAKDVTAAVSVTVTATSVSNPTVTGSRTLTVVPRIQSIAVTSAANHVLEGKTLQLTATTAPADASDAVVWSSSNDAVATVDENGLLTAGPVETATEVNLIATADDGSVDPNTGLPVTGTLTVTVMPVVLTTALTVTAAENITALTALTTVQLSAASTPETVTYPGVTWQSEDETVAKVSASGLVTAQDVAETLPVTLTATATDGSGVTGSLTITVTPRIQSITLSGEGDATTVQEGQQLQLTAVTAPADASDAVVWSSANPTVAAVDENGLVSAGRVNADTRVVITATAADLTGVAGAPVVKQTFTLTVKAIVNITAIALTPTTVNVIGLNTVKINATISPAAATYPTVLWTSANDAVATVDENGLVTAGDVDQVTTVAITATADDENHKTATRTVTVTPRIKTITLNAASHDLLEGKTLQLSAAITPAAASKAVTWNSSDPDQVSVDTKGLVTAKGYKPDASTVTITAVANDGSHDPEDNLVVGTWEVTVCPKTTGLTLAATDALGAATQTISLDAANHTLLLTATVEPAAASHDWVWTVKDPTVLSLTANADGSMTATGLLPGETTVTVAAKDGTGVTAEPTVITVTKNPTPIGAYGAMTLSVGMTAQIDAAAIADTYLHTAITGYAATYDGQTATSKGVKVSSTGLITVEANVNNAVIALTTADKRVFAKIALTIKDKPDALTLDCAGLTPENVIAFGELGSTLTLTVVAKAAGEEVPATLNAISGNAAIVGVSQTDAHTFTLTANGLGTTAITLTANGSVMQPTLTGAVNRLLTGVTLSAPDTVYAGKSGTVSASFTPVDASDKSLVWTWEPLREEDSDLNRALVTLNNGVLSVSAALDRVLDVVVSAAYYTDLERTAANRKTATAIIRLVPLVSAVTVAEVGEPITQEVNGVHLVDIKDISAPIQLAATLSPDGVDSYAAVQWTSSVPAVASVQNGTVTVAKAGDTVITATATDGSKRSGTFRLSVRDLVTDITVTDTSLYHGELIAGTTRQLKLTAACLPLTAANKTVTWSVNSDTPFVSVSSTGVVTVNNQFSGDNFQTAEVIATARDGSGVTGTFSVTVYPAVAGVSIETVGGRSVGDTHVLAFDLNTDESIQPIVCSVAPNDAVQDLVWKSSNASQVAVVAVDGGFAVQLLKTTASTGVTLTATSAVTGTKSDRVTIIVNCLPTEVTITGTNGVAAGKSAQFTATVLPLTASNRTVTWKVEAADGSTLTNTSISPTTGLLRVGTGAEKSSVLKITATCNANDTCFAEYEVTVTPLATGVQITPEAGKENEPLEVTDPGKNTLALTAAVTAGTSGTPAQYVVWKSSATSIATVTASEDDPLKAVVTAVGPGVATITAAAADGGTAKGTLTLQVTCKPQSVSGSAPETLVAGKSYTCTATVLPANAQNRKVTWALCTQDGQPLAAPSQTAAIDANTGVLRALVNSEVTEPETVYVKATCAVTNAADETVASDTLAVTIYQKSVSVSISSNQPADPDNDVHFIDLGDENPDDTLQLYATVHDGAAMQTVKWSTSNARVATVDAETGLVTAKGAGLATITATTADGLARRQAYAVTVGIMVKELTVTAPDTSLIAGKNMNLTATCAPAAATNRAVTWASSEPTVATVSSTGLVTAKAVTESKQVTITASAKDGSGIADSVTLWVLPLTQSLLLTDTDGNPLTALTLNKNQSETSYALTTVNLPQASALGDVPGATQDATYTSSKATVATVNAEGVITAIGEGTAVITATATDGSRKTARVTVSVLCKPELVEISGSSTIASGKSVRLSAQVGPAGVASQAVTWKLDAKDAGLATISASTGTVTAKTSTKVGTVLHVIATANTKDSNGLAVSSEPFALTVMPRTTGVTTNLGLANAAQTVSLYQEAIQLSASCAPAEASQQVLWSSSNGKVATVDPDTGLVTFVSAGTTVITAAAMDGTGLKATVKLTITK